MKAYQIRVGEKYNKLVVISEPFTRLYGKNRAKFRMVECRCECGEVCTHAVPDVIKGRVKSCGCWNSEVTARRNYKHGGTVRGKRDPLHLVWSTIKTRCYNPNAKSYRNYGARGVAMCDEWRDSFQAFREWATATGYIARKLTIDRINPEEGYEPNNCRWIPRSEQNRNKRRHHSLGISQGREAITNGHKIIARMDRPEGSDGCPA